MTNEFDPNSEIENAYDAVVATRTERSNNVDRMTYGCPQCQQYVENVTAHQAIFHPEVTQAYQMQLLGIKPLRDQRGN